MNVYLSPDASTRKRSSVSRKVAANYCAGRGSSSLGEFVSSVKTSDRYLNMVCFVCTSIVIWVNVIGSKKQEIMWTGKNGTPREKANSEETASLQIIHGERFVLESWIYTPIRFNSIQRFLSCWVKFLLCCVPCPHRVSRHLAYPDVRQPP